MVLQDGVASAGPENPEPDHHSPQDHAPQHRDLEKHSRTRWRRQWWVWAGGIVMLVLVACAGWVSVKVFNAYDNLTEAKSALTTGLDVDVADLAHVDRDGLSAAVAQAQQSAAAARGDVDDPLFRAAMVGAVVTGLRQAADGRRILVYSSHPDEQATLRDFGVTGELPASDAADAPTFGVFLNDRTYMGSKLAYYLSGAVQLTADGCRADGSREVTAQVQLNFTAPSSGLPLHVSGSGPNPYVLVTEFRVFAPTGGTVTAAEFDGAPVTMVNGTDLNRSVGLFRVNLQPGSSTTVTLHFLVPAADADSGAVQQPSVYLAPGVHPWPITAPAFPTCG